jgi:hypothetical protein
VRIIYQNEEGFLIVLTPSVRFLESLQGTEVEKLEYIANKDIPAGTKYEIVDDNTLPSDRTFRNAWEYESSANEKTTESNNAD